MKKIYFILLFMTVYQIKAQVFNILSFGAVGDSTTLNTLAIQNAIDSCSNSGGGIVLISNGVYLSGTIFMKSNVTLSIDSGAALKGSANLADYPIVTPALRTFTDTYVQRSLIFAENAVNIAFEGKGIINGNGTNSIFLNSDNRVFGFRIFSCTNVRYENLTLKNSAFWMMHNCNIDTLLIRGLTISNHCFGNQDGVNIDGCRNVLVENCDIDGNNDPIVMKGTFLGWTENVEVRNCKLATYSRAIKIGTETQGSFRNIFVHDCEVVKSTKGPLNRNANCGINLAMVDGGVMENVLIENVNMSGLITPIMIRLGNQARKHEPSAPTPGVGSVKNIRLKNVTAFAESNITSTITGIPGYKAENIWLQNVQISVPGGMAALPPSFLVPENENKKPEHDIFGDTLPSFGIYFRHVDGLQLCNVSVSARQADGRPDYIFDDISRLDSSCITSVKDYEMQNYISLYPNPANTQIQIESEIAVNIEIFNAMGQKVYVTNHKKNNLKLDVANWPVGLYFIKSGMGNKQFLISR
jgi:hypothetical protein